MKAIKFYQKFGPLINNSRNNNFNIINKSEIESIKDKSINNKDFYIGLKDIDLKKNKGIITIKNKNINNQNNKPISSLNKKVNENEKQFSDNFDLVKPYTNNKITHANKNNKSKYIFPLYYYFLDMIFDNLINPTKFFCISKKYFIIYNYMCKVYDISTYILLIKHFHIVNNMFNEYAFADKNYYPSKIIKKININDSKLIEKMNKDLKEKKSIFYSNYFG